MAMEKITFEKAKTIAEKKGLKPGKVKGTNGIQFTKGTNNRLNVISWDEFEKLLNESFKELLNGRTSMVVAHRLSTIQSSDLIVVLKDGAIIEQGTHESLYAKKGFYYELYNAQFN